MENTSVGNQGKSGEKSDAEKFLEAIAGAFTTHPPETSALRGIPMGMLCRLRDIAAHMQITQETWSMFKAAEPPLPVLPLPTKCEWIVTDDLIAWAKGNPTIPPRPSQEKKKARATKKKTKR